MCVCPFFLQGVISQKIFPIGWWTSNYTDHKVGLLFNSSYYLGMSMILSKDERMSYLSLRIHLNWLIMNETHCCYFSKCYPFYPILSNEHDISHLIDVVIKIWRTIWTRSFREVHGHLIALITRYVFSNFFTLFEHVYDFK